MRLATAIITRNAPELADEAFDHLDGIGDGMYLLENGTRQDLISKHASICLEDSRGFCYAANHCIARAIDDGYDLVWINCNDARYHDPAAFADWACRMFEANPMLAVTPAYWQSCVWNMSGGMFTSGTEPVPFFDVLGFIVSTAAAKRLSQLDSRLTPFWDSSNYATHGAILAPSFALYAAGYFMACNSDHCVEEKNVYVTDDREERSLLARGFGDAEWKQKGVPDTEKWFSDYFQGLNGTWKMKRDTLVRIVAGMWQNSSAAHSVQLLR